MGDDAKRFFEKVQKTATCWLWKGRYSLGMYGRFSAARPHGNGRVVSAHRYSYELHHGPIAEGLVIDHTCNIPPCVNPAHLRAVTPKENNLRSNGLAAINARKTECKHGHSFSADNTRHTKAGHRVCLTCRRRHAEISGAKKKEATQSGRGKRYGWVRGIDKGKYKFCVHGHEMNEANLAHLPNGGRYCRACCREKARMRRKAKLQSI